MDTSKEYIEMCRKAVEIQELWEPKWGDFYDYDEDMEILPINVGQLRELISMIKEKRITWFPRQDQLQDMLREWSRPWDNYLMLLHFKKFMQNNASVGVSSFEKYWLAFVMHERWGKKWNGEDWKRRRR